MKRKLSSFSLALIMGIASFLTISPSDLLASSHREAPLTAIDPTIDNTDVYAFRSPDDPSKVTLIANWIPFEEPAGGPNFYHFDTKARYLIKVDRDGNGVADVTYEWTFQDAIQNTATFLYNTGPITTLNDPDYNYRQTYTIAVIDGVGVRTVLGTNLLMPPDHIGPRSTPSYPPLAAAGIYDLGRGEKTFVGQRDDPFFIDLGSIFDLLGLRPFNSAHVIPLANAPGVQDISGFNIHTTAFQVPIALLAPACPVNAAGIPTDPTNRNCVVGVWSTAERREFTDMAATGVETASGNFIQVSRLGNPLVNELIVDLARKDAFNSLNPTGDAAVQDRVTDPELGRLIPILYPGITVPPAPRNDLVAIFLTGIAGLNQQLNSVATPSEQLRLNLAIAPTAGVCQGNPLGVLAGDNAGFPNGRRLEDDVVDIELRAVAGATPFTPAFNRSPNNALGDGVNANDLPCLASFPYMATPSQGYTHSDHLVAGSLTTLALAGDIVTITNSVSPTPTAAGTNVTFTIRVTNNSGATATGVTVTDTLPAGLTFVSASSSAGTCTGTSTISCSVGSLAAGAAATITVVAQTTTGGNFTNTATVTTTTTGETVTGNNTATATATVTATGNPVLTFNPVNPTFSSNTPTSITITISAAQGTPTVINLNSTNSGVAGVPLTVTIPAGALSITVPINVGQIGSATITATLPAGLGGGVFTELVTVAAVIPGIPTVETWGLLLMASFLALAGYFITRSMS
ncbi:MAG TPA: DUF4331 family protein [Thermoanaerobaculia bacterium]|nr:DUF4331 family protein [Thermoanaerobaculia bacterium]